MRPFGTLGLRQPLERSEGGQEGQTFGMRHPRAAPVTKAAAKTGEVGRRGTAAGVERRAEEAERGNEQRESRRRGQQAARSALALGEALGQTPSQPPSTETEG
ncbi:unnamed protein product [Prorocentrum cordatum]|uniref:Uncharacterized protein n=1 Tax=Prorocentrum cordatum TaxID=2364126 RepID=A0ABN9QT97_9DINO|nr:unnamed protein product [Polarella glacialis]